jgi:hypothetical protein
MREPIGFRVLLFLLSGKIHHLNLSFISQARFGFRDWIPRNLKRLTVMNNNPGVMNLLLRLPQS